MAKFFGKVGYGILEETAPDVYREKIVERPYYGDVLENVRKWEVGEGLNDDLNIANKISIVADAFAFENFHSIRYIWFMGSKWIVKSVEVSHPRLLLTIGGVYNEQQAKTE